MRKRWKWLLWRLFPIRGVGRGSILMVDNPSLVMVVDTAKASWAATLWICDRCSRVWSRDQHECRAR